MTKWYQRVLASVLVVAMAFGMVGGFAQEAMAETRTSVKQTTATGDIQATLRMDYPIAAAKLSKATVTLLKGDSEIASGKLGVDGTLSFKDGSGASGDVSLRSTGQTVSYVDISISGLAADNDYKLKFEGDGFKTYTSPVLTLDQYSQGLIVGTSDATFTQGDLNGDGKIDEKDIDLVKEKLDTDDASADLNGDGIVDITDLTLVTMATGATGEAKVYNTSLIVEKVINVESVAEAISQSDTVEIKKGDVASLFANDGQSVTLAAKEGSTELALPIPLTDDGKGVEMEQVEIVSSTANPVNAGVVVAELADGTTMEVPFNNQSDNVLAIQTRDDGRQTVVINLGKKVPVKKITIKVEIVDDQPVVVEQIKFVQDIVPENPAAEDVTVKNLTATAGTKEVTLKWDEFPNVTGYKIYYGTSSNALTSTVETESTSHTVGNLENLKTYYFAVAPISTNGGQNWEGGKSDVVSATPQPNSVPDKPDNVTVTQGDTMLYVTWKPGKDTVSSKVQYREKGTETFTELSGTYQTSANITGLTNGTTYEIQVFGVNNKGNGPVSLTAEGTPKAEQVEGPELPTTNRLENNIVASATYPNGNTDTGVSKGTMPGAVYDNDYRTSWVAKSYQWSREFTFTFDQAYDMNYVIYVPDQGKDTQKNNGKLYRDYFDSFNVKINGETVKATFEAAKNNEYFIVKFPRAQVKTLSIEGSQWAGAGNITLAEVAFYKYDGLSEDVEALFANGSHTKLASGVDQSKIDELKARVNDVNAYVVDKSVLLDELNNAQQLLDKKDSELMIRSGFESRSAAGDSEYGQSASALQPLGVSALSGKTVALYVDGLADGETAKLVQWQQYAEAGTTSQSYNLHNGRNLVWLSVIGNDGSGERGGPLYIEYSGKNADKLTIQVRDVSSDKNVVTATPTLNITPDQWYGKSESERKTLIKTYVSELQTYVKGLSFVNESSKKTNTRNITDIATPSVLLTIPADQALAGLGGVNASVDTMTDKLYQALVAWEQLLFLTNKTQGIIDANAAFNSYQYPMETRQNIRFSRMFSGAFMFAAGSYIGVEYGSTAALVSGVPLTDGSSDVESLYGWGIAHEIGHNMDKIGYAEITNNIYSLVAQTADTQNMTGASRLEGGTYDDIFTKVALGKPGQAGNVFIQLGMYWQLHLAYDGKGSALDGSGALDFYNAFFKKWKAGAYSDAPSKDDRIALIASEVTGKNLTEFFTRWGMELASSTKSKLQSYGTEEREIWYLNDESRRDRLAGKEKASLSAELSAAVANEKQVTLTMTVNGQADRVQGYEISRNGQVIAFVKGDGNTTQTYTDTVGSANNVAMSYSVRVIDKLGYEAASAKAADVRISYDKTIDASQYDIVRDDATGNIVITAKNGATLQTAGLKITGENAPNSGKYLVFTSEEIHDLGAAETFQDLGTVTPTGGWTLAKNGDFKNGEATSDGSFLSYFNKPGAASSDTRIWMYDAKQIAISGVPTSVDLSDIHLLSYPGDNIAFTEGASIAVLEQDYTYEVGDGQTETIKAGTVIVTGSYRGDPLYNSVHVVGKFQTVTPASDAAPTVSEQTLEGETLLLAEVPEDGAVSTISDGFFIFIPSDQEAFKKVCEDHIDEEDHQGTANQTVLIELKAQMWRATDVNGSNPRMTSDTTFISVPRFDSMPGIVFEGEGN